MTFPDFQDLTSTVSRDDRAQAEQALRQAYIEGRIDAAEYDARMGQVITADSPLALASAVNGPLPTPTYRGVIQPVAHQGRGNGMAVLAHLSPLFSWLFGPAIIWVVSARGSHARREAAKSFNFNLIWFVGTVLLGTVAGIILGDVAGTVMRFWFVAWLILTIIGAVNAGKGNDWRNPVRRLVGWEVLSEGRR